MVPGQAAEETTLLGSHPHSKRMIDPSLIRPQQTPAYPEFMIPLEVSPATVQLRKVVAQCS